MTSRQPMVCTPMVISGSSTAPPEENPAMQMDIARDRRRMNHRFTALSSTWPRPALFPVATTPTKTTTNTT